MVLLLQPLFMFHFFNFDHVLLQFLVVLPWNIDMISFQNFDCYDFSETILLILNL